MDSEVLDLQLFSSLYDIKDLIKECQEDNGEEGKLVFYSEESSQP
jgi:hypothetical protein